MDYAQRQKFILQIAAVVACVAGVTALICAQALEADEEWEIDSTTAEMAESVINVCLFIHSHPGCEWLMVL
jgi:hypothetical protein